MNLALNHYILYLLLCVFVKIINMEKKKQFAVYEKEPRHGKDKNGIILAPYNTKKEAEIAGKKYGYYGDNYYVDEMK